VALQEWLVTSNQRGHFGLDLLAFLGLVVLLVLAVLRQLRLHQQQRQRQQRQQTQQQPPHHAASAASSANPSSSPFGPAAFAVGSPFGGSGAAGVSISEGDFVRALSPAKPTFNGSKETWDDFKYLLENFMAALSPELCSLMKFAADSETEIPEVMPGDAKLSLVGFQFYAFLASCLDPPAENKALTLLKEKPTRSGFDAWRRLMKEYEGKDAVRATMRRSQLLQWKLCSIGDQKPGAKGGGTTGAGGGKGSSGQKEKKEEKNGKKKAEKKKKEGLQWELEQSKRLRQMIFWSADGSCCEAERSEAYGAALELRREPLGCEPLKYFGERDLTMGSHLGYPNRIRFSASLLDVLRPLISDLDVQRTHFAALDAHGSASLQHRVSGQQIPLIKRGKLWAICEFGEEVQAHLVLANSRPKRQPRWMNCSWLGRTLRDGGNLFAVQGADGRFSVGVYRSVRRLSPDPSWRRVGDLTKIHALPWSFKSTTRTPDRVASHRPAQCQFCQQQYQQQRFQQRRAPLLAVFAVLQNRDLLRDQNRKLFWMRSAFHRRIQTFGWLVSNTLPTYGRIMFYDLPAAPAGPLAKGDAVPTSTHASSSAANADSARASASASVSTCADTAKKNIFLKRSSEVEYPSRRVRFSSSSSSSSSSGLQLSPTTTTRPTNVSSSPSSSSLLVGDLMEACPQLRRFLLDRPMQLCRRQRHRHRRRRRNRRCRDHRLCLRIVSLVRDPWRRWRIWRRGDACQWRV